MRITRLKLHNFARILSGMGKTTLEIDLSKSSQHINMFIGGNGSGKTATMQCLHPFAFNGSIGDSTGNSDLIIEGKDGKKEIDVYDKGLLYQIVHYYTRKKDGTVSVKSYIMEDGEELNQSGTGIGFKAVVQDKLGVNETFLTLLSVGNSIDGFVELTSADRKTFTTKIFSELGVYATYYKSMTSLARSMNTLLANVTSKLSKYGTYDKTELSSRLDDITTNLVQLQGTHQTVTKDIGGIQAQLDIYGNDVKSYEELQRSLESESNTLTSLRGKLTRQGSLKELLKEKDRQTELLASTKNAMQIKEANMTSLLNTKDSLMNTIDQLNAFLNKQESGQSIEELEQYIKSMESQISELSKKIAESQLVTDLSYDDLIRADIYLKDLTKLTGNLIFHNSDVEFLKRLIYQYLKDPKSVRNKMSMKQEGLMVSTRSHQLMQMVDDLKVSMNDCNHSCDKKNNCPYVLFYNQYMEKVNELIQDSDDQYFRDMEELSLANSAMECVRIMDDCFKFIKSHKDIFRYLPEEVFNPTTFLLKFTDSSTIYSADKLTELVERQEAAIQLSEVSMKLSVEKDKLQLAKTSQSIVTDTKDKLMKAQSDLEVNRQETLKLCDELGDMDKIVEDCHLTIYDLDGNIQVRKDIEASENAIEAIKNTLRKMDDTIQKVEGLKTKLKELRLKEQQAQTNINRLIDIRQSVYSTINHINTLEQEEIEIREKYDDVMEIRKAVSPVTGIPVEFIEYYVKSEMIDRMNTLLDSVYHGKLRLRGDLVIINEKEFTIPYQKNNTIVKDISKASDGERAIMTFAFSLVLIQSSMDIDKYNIMLLDEIDTSLDHYGRSRFIDLLETFMGTINAEQIFLISHNNMFDSYPVNVIMTSEMNLSNMSIASVMKLYE